MRAALPAWIHQKPGDPAAVGAAGKCNLPLWKGTIGVGLRPHYVALGSATCPRLDLGKPSRRVAFHSYFTPSAQIVNSRTVNYSPPGAWRGDGLPAAHLPMVWISRSSETKEHPPAFQSRSLNHLRTWSDPHVAPINTHPGLERPGWFCRPASLQRRLMKDQTRLYGIIIRNPTAITTCPMRTPMACHGPKYGTPGSG